jgi:transcriptional regulator with XRE-family HTH domain
MLKLREWRERRGLSLRGLAEKSGVHYVHLIKIEAGRNDPRLSTILKLCKALGVEVADLIRQPTRKGGMADGSKSRTTKG